MLEPKQQRHSHVVTQTVPAVISVRHGWTVKKVQLRLGQQDPLLAVESCTFLLP